MKINAQDEYGLRILLRIARAEEEGGLSISQLSEEEGLSTHYVAKLTRTLRLAGFIKSSRGHTGGYALAKAPEEIRVNEVLQALGGLLFDDEFCRSHSGNHSFCTNSIDCSVRSLWKLVQHSLDQVLSQVTLRDLTGAEMETDLALRSFFR